jgi:four helix bundle protein
MKKSILVEKSFDFALRIVKLYTHLASEKKEFIISKQCLKSGTAIGAIINEGLYAQSRPDFVNKLSIALKESGETAYWLKVLHATGYINEKSYQSMKADDDELLRILIASIKTAKKPPRQKN